MIFMRAAAAALAAVLLTAAGLPASAADKVKFVLDWFPTGDIGFTHVGVKRGFFAEEGLDVSIDIGKGGSDAVTRVGAGSADFGSAGLSSIFNAAANAQVPIKAVISVFSKSPDSIMTKAGNGINSIKDLAGKTVATATFSSSNPVWPVIAKANGVDPDTVKLLKVDTSALGPMLASGSADAIIAWLTTAPLYGKLVATSGATLTVLPWSQYGLKGYNWSIIVSDRMLKERPDVARRFVRAYLKTMNFVLENPDQAGRDLHDMAPDTDADTNIAQAKAMIPLVKNEISDKYGLGVFDPSLVKETWTWVSRAQGYPIDKIDPETMIDRSLLPK